MFCEKKKKKYFVRMRGTVLWCQIKKKKKHAVLSQGA